MSLVPVVQAAGVVSHMIFFLPLHTSQPWFMDIITFRKFLSISRLCEVKQRKLFLGLISNARCRISCSIDSIASNNIIIKLSHHICKLVEAESEAVVGHVVLQDLLVVLPPYCQSGILLPWTRVHLVVSLLPSLPLLRMLGNGQAAISQRGDK